MIKRIITIVKQRFVRCFTKSTLYMSQVVEDLPSQLKTNKVYLVGSDQDYWLAAILCPCGCGSTLHMNLLQSNRPCWNVQVYSDNTVSLYPSLWRKSGCQSHFFLTNGKVKWVPNK